MTGDRTVSGASPAPLRPAAGGADAVVVGAGVFGVWAAWRLHRRGFRVTLVDAWGPGHSRASSGGESRVTRAAYGADELYARWARASLPHWKALAARTGQRLFHETGMLWLGAADSPRLISSRATLTRLGVPHAVLGPDEIAVRFPQFALDGVGVGLWEPEAGALLARRAVAALAAELEAAGVRRLLARIEPPTPSGGRIAAVRTTTGETLAADRFVFACGPWMGRLFPELLGPRLFVTRQEVFFFGTAAGDGRFQPPRMPTYMVGDFYGLPDLEGRGLKVANDEHGEPLDPDTAERLPSAPALAAARAFVAARFPALRGAPLLEARVCQYENSADGDLLVDLHPEAANAVLVGCGSGHGFKHGPSVGELAAALAAGDDGVAPDPRLALAAKATLQHRAVH
jgi:monomeric sarcosine oxidase